MSDEQRLTTLLGRVYEGCDGAMDRLMHEVYQDLNGIAGRHMRRQFGAGLPGVTLEPSALVNETFLRLVKQRQKYDNRGHFFAIATRLMLRVLIDYQRSRSAKKRAGDQIRVTLTGIGAAVDDDPAAGVSDLQQALEELEQLDPRTADVLKMRVIWGLTVPEVAESLSISVSTVEREWRFARSWLRKRLTD